MIHQISTKKAGVTTLILNRVNVKTKDYLEIKEDILLRRRNIRKCPNNF